MTDSQGSFSSFEDFKELVTDLVIRKPVWFGLSSDEAATVSELAAVEEELGLSLPREYTAFLQEFGGGYFAFTNVFSVQPSSEWYVVERNRNAPTSIDEFLAISDNGVGDYYGFRVHDGSCGAAIAFWDHEERMVKGTEFSNVLEYLACVGLRQ